MATARAGPQAAQRPPLRTRARKFVFEGQAEHERFGVFDPAARMSFGVVVLTLAILVGLTAAESVGTGSPSLSAAVGLAVMFAVGLAGYMAYRRVWVRPPEREVLLQLAREEDESRALFAARERERDAQRKRERVEDSER